MAEECLLMSAKSALAVAAILIVLFGCSTPGIGQQPAPAPVPIPPPDTALQEQQINISISNESENGSLNGTIAPEEDGGEFAGIMPRSVSPKIYDGQFKVREDFAAPLKVYVIADGQADAVLVNKGKFYMLVDAGNFTQVDSYLKKLGVKRLNVVVATRDYSGAIGGLPELLDAYEVDEVWENGAAQEGTPYVALLQKAGEKGIVTKVPSALDEMSVSGLDVMVLNPGATQFYSNPDIDSIVLKLSAGEFCMLLLNPTVQERDNAIISTGESLRCDVITYYRHGEGRPEPSVLV